jgi:hypothetical protein
VILVTAFTVAHVLSSDSGTYPDTTLGNRSPRSEFWESDAELPDFSESDDDEDARPAKAMAHNLDSKSKEFSWKLKSKSDPWEVVSANSSIRNSGLDWLLLPLGSGSQSEDTMKLDQSTNSPTIIYPEGTPSDLSPDVQHIAIVAGQGGNQPARPSPTLSGVFIPSAGRVLQVWPVNHEPGALRPGDSGSWAIGDNGKVYGYVVCACEGLGVSYLAPFALAMGGIHALVGGNVMLPARVSERANVVSEARQA